MAQKPFVNSAHQPGNTYLAFARDGSRIYTGGSDALIRIWRTDVGTSQEPDVALDALESITCVAAGNECWLSGGEDAQVRKYYKGKPDLEAQVTSAAGVSIRSVAVDPKGTRVAVTSDETYVKVIDLEDTTKMSLLKGHTKAVRRATWHPSGSLLTTCGADGKIIVWEVSDDEAKEVKVIDGMIPAVTDTESEEFSHDCSAVWHTSGQYFFVATRTHEIVTISRSDWAKSSTFADDASSGAITALALSKNGVYLASACKSGLFIWSTQTRKLLFRFQGSLSSAVTEMAFSPSQNLLAWTDREGVLTRWPEPIPATSPDPVKMTAAAGASMMTVKKKSSLTLFDDDNAIRSKKNDEKGDVDLDEDLGMEDLDNDDWILDDLGGGMNDDDEAKRWSAKEGVREMVSVTKAQPAFQPGSSPMENKKRYLAYNMIGVVEVTDQDTHHIVNVEFHDRTTRKGYHFTDHFKYDLASLGERGALYACQPEADHPAHVLYKSYGTWANQSEWTYELPKGTKVLGIAAGGPPPTKSFRTQSDSDIQGNGNVVIATSENELIFLTGSGIERCCLSLQGDFVSMVAGPEWVFVVHRDGATTMDGSQNLTGRLIKFEDYCLLQKDSLPIPKGHSLKWIGISEEGAPVIFDSAGVLNALPRFRLPFSATWTRILDTNSLERREGKHESYWPVGVAGETFMCIILKGRQEHPGFPRPLMQELQLRFPFKRTDPKEGPLEEHFARETMLLDMLRDGLGEELTTDEISRRELALDKELIQLIQNACKNDKLSRAIDLAKLLHHTASFDMSIKVAGFYHLIGLQEKMEALKDDREDDGDRLVNARDKRRERQRDFAAVPAMKAPIAEPSKPKPFQDFRPPPAIHRPGLERATPAADGSRAGPSRNIMSSQATAYEAEPSFLADDSVSVNNAYESSPDGKRKRTDIIADNSMKRRAIGESISEVRTAAAPPPRSNPFARKPGADKDRNPFARSADMNKSLHKSESFFHKVDAAEIDKSKRPPPAAKGKSKDKKEMGRQTTLFGLPAVAPPEKKAPGRKKKANGSEESQQTLVDKSQADSEKTPSRSTSEKPPEESETQNTDVTMTEESQTGTQVDDEPSQVPTEIVESQAEREDSCEPIEWPDSPRAESMVVEADA